MTTPFPWLESLEIILPNWKKVDNVVNRQFYREVNNFILQRRFDSYEEQLNVLVQRQNAGRRLTILCLFYFYTERSIFRTNAIYLTVFALALYKLNEHFARWSRMTWEKIFFE